MGQCMDNYDLLKLFWYFDGYIFILLYTYICVLKYFLKFHFNYIKFV